MSMKIYDAFAVTDPTADVFTVSARLHEIITPVFHRLRSELMVRATGRVIDRAGLDRPQKHERPMPFLQARQAWLEEQGKIEPDVRGHDPLAFQAVFARVSSGELLVKVFSEEPQYAEAMAADPLFADHSYWNNTDAPEDVSDEQWEGRRQDWEEAYHRDHGLAHAPAWSLENTLANTFTLSGMMDRLADPNQVTGPRRRLERAIRWVLLDDTRVDDVKDAMGVYMDACGLAAAVAKALPEDDAWMPAPFGDLVKTWDDIALPTWPTVGQILECAGELGVKVPASLTGAVRTDA